MESGIFVIQTTLGEITSKGLIKRLAGLLFRGDLNEANWNHPISFPESADSGTLGTRLGSSMFKERLEAVHMSCVLPAVRLLVWFSRLARVII